MLLPQSISRWGAFALFVLCLPHLCAAGPAPTQPLDNPLEPLSPIQKRTEEEEDRLTAIALFSTGRMLEQRDQPAQAIRRYQRALRYDADAVPALAELVPLAFQANRADEALRYLVKYGDRLSLAPELLMQSGQYLLAADDQNGAIILFQRALAQLEKQPASPLVAQVLAALGQLHYVAGESQKAAPQFVKLLDALKNPDRYRLSEKNVEELAGPDGQLLELMGTALIEAGKVENAREAFEKLNELFPSESRALLNRARIDFASRNAAEALVQLDEYFQLINDRGDDENVSAVEKGLTPYQLLQAVLAKLDRGSELIPRLEKMYESAPENAALTYFLGEQLLQAGKWEPAQKYLEASLAEKPTVKTYQSLATVYRQTKQTDDLLKLLAQVVDKTGALVLLGDELTTLTADRETVDAILELANHQEAKRKNRYSLTAAALLAVEAKRWDEAEKLFDLALATRPKNADELVLHWALRLLLDDKPTRAEKVLRRGIAEKSWRQSHGAFYFYLATALELQDRFDDALEAARNAEEKQPDNPLFASRPAATLYHAKRNDEAEKAYEAFVSKYEYDFKTPGARQSVQEAKQVLSHLALLRGDLEQSIEWLEQVLDEFPDDDGANNDLGYLWADENQHLQRARRMIQLAVAAQPDNAAYRDSLGWVLYRLGRYGEALVELQKAAGEPSADGTVLEHLGDTYEKLGRLGEAKNAWSKALEAFKKADEKEKIEQVEKKLSL